MQSKITGETKVQEQEYPCLKVFRSKNDNDHDKIVLFTHPNVGTVVHTFGNCHTIGEWSNEWLEFNFQPFNGTVELSN